MYFVALGEELNYGAAAARLRISKPTLSQQIRVLERSLGRPLLKRGSRALTLTPAGEVLLEEAREVLASCDRLRRTVLAASPGPYPLDIRVVNGLQHAVADQLASLQEDPALHVNLTTTSGLDAEDAVMSGRADAALIWVPTGLHSTLHARQVGSSAVSLALPVAHPLARLEVVPVAALADERVALFPRRVAPRLFDLFCAHLLPDGPRPGQVDEEPTALMPMMGMLRAAAQGRAVAPFVDTVGEALAPDGVVLRPMDPPLELPIHLVCRSPNRPDLRHIERLLTPA